MNVQIKASQSTEYPINGYSALSAAFAYANSIANTVQGFYTDGNRTHYALRNLDLSLVHKLDGFGNLNVTDLANADGISYANQTLDVYVKTSDGVMHYSGNSGSAGRMNTCLLYTSSALPAGYHRSCTRTVRAAPLRYAGWFNPRAPV